MTRTPSGIFLHELASIEELYVLSLWVYNQREAIPSAEDVLNNSDGTLSLCIPGFPPVGKYRNIGHINTQFRSGLPRELRQVLYVQTISALEVFLIESIKFAFTKNPFLLASQKKLEIPHAKLIAARTISEIQWEIVSNETRRL